MKEDSSPEDYLSCCLTRKSLRQRLTTVSRNAANLSGPCFDMWVFYYLSFPYSQEKGPTGGPAQDSLADEFRPVRIK